MVHTANGDTIIWNTLFQIICLIKIKIEENKKFVKICTYAVDVSLALGTIPILCQHIFRHFMTQTTHYVSMVPVLNISKNDQISQPAHSPSPLADVI